MVCCIFQHNWTTFLGIPNYLFTNYYLTIIFFTKCLLTQTANIYWIRQFEGFTMLTSCINFMVLQSIYSFYFILNKIIDNSHFCGLYVHRRHIDEQMFWYLHKFFLIFSWILIVVITYSQKTRIILRSSE